MKIFALKKMRSMDEEIRLIAKKEFKMMKQLNHVNIIKNVDYFENHFT